MQQDLQYWKKKLWLKACLAGKVNPCLYQSLAWEAAGKLFILGGEMGQPLH